MNERLQRMLAHVEWVLTEADMDPDVRRGLISDLQGVFAAADQSGYGRRQK